jgi:lysophospholipase L1-like esterase
MSTSRDRPSWRNAATSGATSAIVSARIAAEVTQCNPTHFILQLGVNDAQTGVVRATTLANMTAIFAALPVGCQILYLDPFAWGEKWPTGQNGAVDTAIDFISLDVQALLAATYPTRSTFVSLRHGIYDVAEPALNTPGPGTLIGPLTRPDTLGAHPNATCVGYITAIAAKNILYSI